MIERTRVFLDMIKFEHTIFALPFAYQGMVLAADGLPTLQQFIWITVAMVAARTLAMAVNRLIDRDFDARNPRTAIRALPRGLITPRTVVVIAIAMLVLFYIAAWQLNTFVLLLATPALIFLIGYSYAKRFTWLTHWILGFTDGIAAAGAWAAVRGSLDLPALLLWFTLTVWIAGFDLIYACQDVEIDRQEGLHSVPARFGIARALKLARLNHQFTIAALALVGFVMHLAWPYWVGVVIAGLLLAYENSIVKPDDLSRVNLAFFTLNGYISIIVFIGTLLAVLLY